MTEKLTNEERERLEWVLQDDVIHDDQKALRKLLSIHDEQIAKLERVRALVREGVSHVYASAIRGALQADE
jgi:L-lysine 2,3-aminomutase